jgi:hypothetical protein
MNPALTPEPQHAVKHHESKTNSKNSEL